MDFTIQSTPAAPAEDFGWLASGIDSFDAAQSGTLDTTALTSGTHYDAASKVVPSGLLVARTAAGLYVPWAPGASDGTEVLAGAVGRPVQLGSGTRAVFARIIDAVIKPALLPVAAQRVVSRTTTSAVKFGFLV